MAKRTTSTTDATSMSTVATMTEEMGNTSRGQ
jgi:hypothetical protein